MTQTLEEKNKVNRRARHSLKMKRRNSCIEMFTNLYNNARRFHWEREFINQSRNDVWASDTFKCLPEIWREFVRGAAHILSEQFEKELVWTHLHPKIGQRVRTKDKSLEGFYPDINSDESCFCYELEDGRFEPIDKEHRDK